LPPITLVGSTSTPPTELDGSLRPLKMEQKQMTKIKPMPLKMTKKPMSLKKTKIKVGE
jgi:hypothetical protein